MMSCSCNQALFILDSTAMRNTAKKIVNAHKLLLNAIHNFGVRCAACDHEIKDAVLGRGLAIVLHDIHYFFACCIECANSEQLDSAVRSRVEDNLHLNPERYILAPDHKDGELKESTTVESDMPQEIDDDRWFSKNPTRHHRIRRSFASERRSGRLPFRIVNNTEELRDIPKHRVILPADILEDNAIAIQNDEVNLVGEFRNAVWLRNRSNVERPNSKQF